MHALHRYLAQHIYYVCLWCKASSHTAALEYGFSSINSLFYHDKPLHHHCYHWVGSTTGPIRQVRQPPDQSLVSLCQVNFLICKSLHEHECKLGGRHYTRRMRTLLSRGRGYLPADRSSPRHVAKSSRFNVEQFQPTKAVKFPVCIDIITFATVFKLSTSPSDCTRNDLRRCQSLKFFLGEYTPNPPPLV